MDNTEGQMVSKRDLRKNDYVYIDFYENTVVKATDKSRNAVMKVNIKAGEKITMQVRDDGELYSSYADLLTKEGDYIHNVKQLSGDPSFEKLRMEMVAYLEEVHSLMVLNEIIALLTQAEELSQMKNDMQPIDNAEDDFSAYEKAMKIV